MTTRILTGDCIESMQNLADESVHCCVTSPPYYGLRDYGTATWQGGDSDCNHQVGEIRTGLGMAALGAKYSGGGHKASEPKPMYAKEQCPHCGAVRVDKQIGLENKPEEFIDRLVSVFREVKRVLRNDGTLWVNIGDSYASNTKGSGGLSKKQLSNTGIRYAPRKFNHGVKEKDLIGIPWTLAFALRADGWYLRQDVIWHKPNPMPESVTDRCTKAHEYIFMLSKSSKYFF